ncbi:Serine/threonine-protein phosphatase [Mycena indigotica]|uniref:Serine/threonine-protein phosphatase n=1 Tax=Mycena indigotica TaxID=2126181 RepID=A0A8H6SSA8_9AGAR|nr:Serine/threonine-protein phosphatase [Mycena indigotica]KAF7304155.1 Serine/threonine-protein phosphatase [Mycena indigotica]
MFPNGTPPTGRLAPELTDQIIDILHRDHFYLVTCSLVCKAWLARTRYHLFQNVVLAPRLTKPHTLTKCRDFLTLSRAPLCTFLPFVTKLSLDHGCEHMAPLILSSQEIFGMLAAVGIAPITLVHRFLEHSPLISASPHPFFAKSVTHLDLSFSKSGDWRSVVEYICAFTKLESLRIRDDNVWRASWHDNLTTMATALPMPLRDIIIDNPTLLMWLSEGHAARGSLHKLRLSFSRHSSGIWPTINAFFRHPSAQALEWLELDRTRLPSQLDEPLEGPEIASLSNLKHLQIAFWMNAAGSLLRDLLGRLQNPTNQVIPLETLTLKVSFPPAAAYISKDWQAIDAFLGSELTFPHLRRVEFAVKELAPEILRRNHLPSLADQLSILAFEAELDRPIASALRSDLRRCGERSLLHIDEGFPLAEPKSPEHLLPPIIEISDSEDEQILVGQDDENQIPVIIVTDTDDESE